MHLFKKWINYVAALVMFCAMSNIENTCLFWSYQPDVPKELLK